MSIRIATIIGARPQYIKHSLLSNEIRKRKNIKDFVILTGQHFDYNMSKIFEKELNYSKPYINLNINKNTSINNISKTILRLENILISLKLDFVIVYGDTDTTLSGALVAKKLNIPLIHIESGLRSFDQSMPEEQNRVIVDHISDYLITPTKIASKNLEKEGIKKNKIYNYGDIMYETWLYFKKQIKNHDKILKKYNITKNDYYLVTLHRQSNTQNINILKKIFKQFEKNKSIFVFPIHPRTKKLILISKLKIPSNILPLNPLSYKEMICLQLNSILILTDSGGLQKEAYFAKKNCYILRNNTEWKELTENKYSVIVKNNQNIFNKDFVFNKKFNSKFYGEGNTCNKIINLLYKNAK